MNAGPNGPAWSRVSLVAGYGATVVSAALGMLWSFWGIVENFHEGWYSESLLENLGMLFAQYLVMAMVFTSAAALAVVRPRLGAIAHVLLAAGAWWFFRGASVAVILPLISAPLLALAAAYAWGTLPPRRYALAAVVGLPLLTLVVSGAYPAWVVATRVDDGDRGARVVRAGGRDLVWAPAGPGWPDNGTGWDDAVRICRYLSADGLRVEDTPQNIWRLPTIEEAVASQARHGVPSGGRWDAAARTPTYDVTPDKEPPLWNPHSKIVYWWTASEASPTQAFRLVYNGRVIATRKSVHWGYLGFRAVRDR